MLELTQVVQGLRLDELSLGRGCPHQDLLGKLLGCDEVSQLEETDGLGADDGHKLLPKVSLSLVLFQISHPRLFDALEGALEVVLLDEMFGLPVRYLTVHSSVV